MMQIDFINFVPFVDLTFSWGILGLGDTLGFGTISGSDPGSIPLSGGIFGTSGSILLTSGSVDFDIALLLCSSWTMDGVSSGMETRFIDKFFFIEALK